MEAEWSSSSNTRSCYRAGHVVPKQFFLLDEVCLPGREEMTGSLLSNLSMAFVLYQVLRDPLTISRFGTD
jgi:hypothetical protein